MFKNYWCNHCQHVNITPPFTSDLLSCLYPMWFNSTFMILFSFVDSIWLVFTGLTRYFWFDSTVPYQFYSSFIIQFDSIFLFDSTATTFIWLTVYNLTQNLWCNLTFHFQFNWTYNLLFNLTLSYYFIWHTLHILDASFMI